MAESIKSAKFSLRDVLTKISDPCDSIGQAISSSRYSRLDKCRHACGTSGGCPPSPLEVGLFVRPIGSAWDCMPKKSMLLYVLHFV